MGMPARRFEAEPFRRTRLTLVPDPPARTAPAARTQRAPRAATRVPARSRAAVRADESRARGLFTVFLTLMIAVVLLGGVRVAFIARAAEASLSESRLQAEISAERAERDKLEVEKSSLASPSRIADIAEASLAMGQPKSVRYLTIDTATEDSSAKAGTTVAAASGAGAAERVFGAIMQLTAGEAQSLLVGDLGLAGSR